MGQTMSGFAAVAIILIFALVGIWLLFFAERERARQFQLLERPWVSTYFRGIGATFIAFALFAGWSVMRAEAAPPPSPLWLPMPGVAELPQSVSSREICDRASTSKAQFRPDTVHSAILGYVVEPNGAVDDITVVGSSGSKQLDQTIVACLTTLRFQPPPNSHAMMVQWK